MASGLPFAGVDQPIQISSSPRTEQYRPRQMDVGRVSARASGGPQVVSSGAGLEQVGRGISAWGPVLARQEEEKQRNDFLDQMTAFQDKERLEMDRVSQLQGEAAFQSFDIMTDFYKNDGEALMGWAKSDFQKDLVKNFLAGARDQGLNFAIKKRADALQEASAKTLEGRRQLLIREVAANPDSWRDAAERFDILNRTLNPGQPESWYEAGRADFSDQAIKEAVVKKVALGQFDEAKGLVEGWGGVGALGGLAAKHESGKDGIKAVGWDPNGGTSYGTYQISSRKGTYKDFVNWLRKKGYEEQAEALSRNPADGGQKGQAAAVWKQLAADGKLTHEMEHAFIKESHYDVAMNKIADPSLRAMVNEHPALQDVVWSTAVQHGGTGGAGVLNRAFKEGMSPEDFINSVYGRRTDDFKGHKNEISVSNRFKREASDARRMLNSEGNNATLHRQLLNFIDTGKNDKEQELRVQAQDLTPLINDEMTMILKSGQDNPAILPKIERYEREGHFPIGAAKEYLEGKQLVQEVYDSISEAAANATSIPDQINKVRANLAPDPKGDAGQFARKAQMQEMAIKSLQDQWKQLNADPVVFTSAKADEIIGKEINEGLINPDDAVAIFENKAAISRMLAADMGAGIEALGEFPLSKQQVKDYTAILEQARTPMERLDILGGIYDATGKERNNVFKQLKLPYEEMMAVEMSKSVNPLLIRAARVAVNKPDKNTRATSLEISEASQNVVSDSDFAKVAQGRVDKSRGLDGDAVEITEGIKAFTNNMISSLVESGKDIGQAQNEAKAALDGMTQGVKTVNDDYMSIYLRPGESGPVLPGTEAKDQAAVAAGLRYLSRFFSDNYYWVNDGDDHFVLVSQENGAQVPYDGSKGKGARVSRADAASLSGGTIQLSAPSVNLGRFGTRGTLATQQNEKSREEIAKEVIARMGSEPPPEDQHRRFIEALRVNSVKMGQ